MIPILSPNTKAILLLTAPLIVGRSATSSDLLKPGEYKRLARHLLEMQRQPADLLSPESAELIQACQVVINKDRLKQLLGRGFLLSQAVERWHARAIWVLSRADDKYPRCLKKRLKEDAPAVLYGCGDIDILSTGGLAVVGSRHVEDSLIDYTLEIGCLSAKADKTLVSGGAKGIDQAAMRGALEAGGRVSGVLADGLEKAAMNREYRELLMNGKLALVSPYDPSVGFSVGNAMQRNKLIYALADVALVVSSDYNKGGTWAGATEQLDKLRLVSVYIRSTGKIGIGLEELRRKGALPWPNPKDSDSFSTIFDAAIANAPINHIEDRQQGLSFFAQESVSSYGLPPTTIENSNEPEPSPMSLAPEISPVEVVSVDVANPAESLFASVGNILKQLLSVPMKDVEIATALNVSTKQAKEWLQRLVDEGELDKDSKSVRYIARQFKQQGLFEPQKERRRKPKSAKK